MYSAVDRGMAGYTRYDKPTAFGGGAARVLADALYSEEAFVLGIDCADGKYLKRWGRKLVLTDQRVIAIQSKVIGSSVEDYRLESINRVEYESTALTGELSLSGAGFAVSYDVPKGMGDDFANAIRNQL